MSSDDDLIVPIEVLPGPTSIYEFLEEDEYDRNQMKMFEDIQSTYLELMELVNFDDIIPTGTAIQNARTDDFMSAVDRELTRDGYHLGETGSYIASLTTFNTFFTSVDVTWRPVEISSKGTYIGRISSKNAILQPFKITNIS